MFKSLKKFCIPKKEEPKILPSEYTTSNTKIFLKCDVCGFIFSAHRASRYIVGDHSNTEINNPELYDAFDCPSCGCQIIAQSRKRSYIPKEQVLYLCDQRACKICNPDHCKHTSDISHAISFKKSFESYVEVEHGQDKTACVNDD